jgi:hypothetical protein
VDDVGWKRLRWLAAISLTIGVVSGCGEAGLTDSVSDAGSSVAGAIEAPDPTVSADYCQLLGDGRWVTNDSATSTTPCVPDPSHATGDEQDDASIAVPRCYTCKLADWQRAEKQAAVRTGHAPATSTAANAAAGAGRWSTGVHKSFVSDCSAYMDGSECECLAKHLQWQVPTDQAEGLSGDDPRVQAAGRDCKS